MGERERFFGWWWRNRDRERKKEREGESRQREREGAGMEFCCVLRCFADYTILDSSESQDKSASVVVSGFLRASLQEQTGRLALETTACQLEAN